MEKPLFTITPNGLKTIIYHSSELITSSILVLVKAGTDYENKKNNGISHFLEHLFFKGTKNFPSSKDLGLELDKIGAEYNAFTSYEYTGYYIKTLPEYFERAIYLMADLLINPIFPDEEIKKEKSVILEEIHYHKDNPLSFIFDETLKICYGDQPAGWSILGKEKVIQKISRADIFNYFNSHYSTSNSLVVISSRMAPAKIINFLKKHFKNYRKNKPQKKYKFRPTNNFQGNLLTKKDLNQAHLVFLFRIPGLKKLKDEKYLVNLLTIILGHGLSSRLFRILREELGVTYYLRVSVDYYTDRGYIYIQTGSSLDKIEITISKIFEELMKIKKEQIPDEEFEKSLAILKNNLISSLENSLNICYFYGLEYLLNHEIITPQDIFKKIEKITSLDIKKTADNYFRKENLTYGLLIPPFLKSQKLNKIFKNIL